MNGEKRIWSQHVANLARAAFWFALLAILLLQLLGSRGQDSQRAALLGNFEKERNSRVIAMIHRQESASILGVPVASSISIDDSEAILRAIRLTPPDQPIDLILHTPGGLVLAAEQIAKALVERKAKVTVFVPHYAMSGGTLIALAADEIVMDANAVLGPVDPQIGQSPAASVLTVIERKKPEDIDDQTLILADVSRKAITQLRRTVQDLLGERMAQEQPATLAGAIEDLDERGFTEHFVLRNGRLRALNTGKNFAADQVVIAEHYRFEGISDPDDMAILYAIETRSGLRGTLTDAFGVYSDPRIGDFIDEVVLPR